MNRLKIIGIDLDRNMIIERASESFYIFDAMKEIGAYNVLITEVHFEDWKERKLPRKKYLISELF